MADHVYRSGLGYDLHRLATGESLILGGVAIPSEGIGTVAHSDGDVLAHAICDALLGAAALGDIGEHFPDTDEAFAGADSMHLLAQVAGLLRSQGYDIVNIDATIVLERPKLAPYRHAMQERIEDRLGLAAKTVSVKATTSEKVGPVGTGDAIAAYAIAMIRS